MLFYINSVFNNLIYIYIYIYIYINYQTKKTKQIKPKTNRSFLNKKPNKIIFLK